MRRASVTACFRKSKKPGPGVPRPSQRRGARVGRASTQVSEGRADFDALTSQQLQAISVGDGGLW